MKKGQAILKIVATTLYALDHFKTLFHPLKNRFHQVKCVAEHINMPDIQFEKAVENIVFYEDLYDKWISSKTLNKLVNDCYDFPSTTHDVT